MNEQKAIDLETATPDEIRQLAVQMRRDLEHAQAILDEMQRQRNEAYNREALASANEKRAVAQVNRLAGKLEEIEEELATIRAAHEDTPKKKEK